MTAIRGARSAEGRYVQIRNGALQDNRLSFRARGVMAYVLSMPPEMAVNAAEMAKDTREGRDAVRGALKELEEFGYLRRIRTSGGRGAIRTETVVTDDPDLIPGPGNPSPDNPPSGPIRGTGFPAPVSQAVTTKDGEKDEERVVSDDAAPTVDDRARAIADEFKLRYKLGTPYIAVLKIVKSAINDGRYTDDQIIRALVRLGEDGRPVSGNTLLIELAGLKPSLRVVAKEPSAYESSPASRGLDEVLW